MNKNDIIEYVMNTPHNTNRAVLSSMLNQLVEDNSGLSDFNAATVTVVNNTGQTVRLSPDFYHINGHEPTFFQSAFLINDETGVAISLDDGIFQNTTTESYTFYVVKDKNFTITIIKQIGETLSSDYEITGLAENTYVEIEDEQYHLIAVYGDCTITINGGDREDDLT